MQVGNIGKRAEPPAAAPDAPRRPLQRPIKLRMSLSVSASEKWFRCRACRCRRGLPAHEAHRSGNRYRPYGKCGYSSRPIFSARALNSGFRPGARQRLAPPLGVGSTPALVACQAATGDGTANVPKVAVTSVRPRPKRQPSAAQCKLSALLAATPRTRPARLTS